MSLAPEIAIHVTAALGAVVTGPVALWARKSREQRPRLHRAAGYAWVTLMLITAFSAMFIQNRRLPNIAGFSPGKEPRYCVSGVIWEERGDLPGETAVRAL